MCSSFEHWRQTDDEEHLLQFAPHGTQVPSAAFPKPTSHTHCEMETLPMGLDECGGQLVHDVSLTRVHVALLYSFTPHFEQG